MDRPRAEIIDTNDPLLLAAQIEIKSSPRSIFDLLADPAMHSVIDGSGSVQRALSGPRRLYLGAKFGMHMKIGIKYRITNTVVEYRENELIGWRHLGRWIWRYELRELGPNQTEVTESFDGRPSPLQWWLKARNAYPFTEKAVAKTLVRLKNFAEEGSSANY